MLACMKEALEVITRLYPEIPEEDRPTAAANLVRYLRALLDLADDICADPERLEHFMSLTESHATPTMEATRSSITSPNATDIL